MERKVDDVKAVSPDGLDGLNPLVKQLETKWKVLRSITEEGEDFPDIHDLMPSIAVIGNKGTGKSSLLETLIKSNFLPTGAGTMTKCPLVLQLRNIDGDDEYVEFKDSNTRHLHISDVKKEINARCSDKVLSHPITLSLFSRKVPSINIIDLPGFTEVAVEGQLDNAIQNMARAVTKKPNCIILVICPANEDPTHSDAIKISQQVDPKGQRTFGVITKVDLVDNFSDVINVLEQRTAQFIFPWICVCNRSEQDIGNRVDMADAFLREHIFFAELPECNHAPSMGSEELTKRISKVLTSLLTETVTWLESELNPFGIRHIDVGPANSVPWVGLPKSSLAPVRSQGVTKTCSFQASMVTTETHYIADHANKTPPQVFPYQLSLSDFQAMHKQKFPKAERTRGNSGGDLWQVMRVLKETGVYGNHVSTGEQSADRFKILDYKVYQCDQILQIILLLDDMKAVVAKFPCSVNYFNMEVNEVYCYDSNDKSINQRLKQRAHCVMVVGYIKSDLEKLLGAIDLVSDHEEKTNILLKGKLTLAYQNSYGGSWGVCGGYGFVECSSIRRYYLPVL